MDVLCRWMCYVNGCVLGGDARRGAAESEPRVALSMGRKVLEIPKENKGFQRSWGVMHGAMPQNLSLEWPSVWGMSMQYFCM